MNRWVSPYSAQLYAIMRIVLGLLFTCHGTQKLLGVPGVGTMVPKFSLMGLAGAIELFGGILITIGLWVGWAAFIASGQMAFAYFIAHAPHGFWPVINHGELAVVYCFVFLYMASHGSGIWSVDSCMGTRGGV
jgi:putative oxidoreductase